MKQMKIEKSTEEKLTVDNKMVVCLSYSYSSILFLIFDVTLIDICLRRL